MSALHPTTGPVRSTDRKPLTRKQRAELFELRGGVCHICGGKITVGQAWEDEHVLPLSMGGSNDLSNRALAHVKCHARKSATETTSRAKADRIRAKHTGAWVRRGPKLQGRGFSKRGEL